MTDDPMFFPEAPRVIYDRSSLHEVICQVRFHDILRIQSQVPADFQERIRDLFPIFQRQAPAPGEFPPEIAQMVAFANSQAPTQYLFEDEQGAYSLSLMQNALALTARNYVRWEEFARFLQPALQALVEIYRPNFFLRVGLRYQNLIMPHNLGFEERAWHAVLSRNILGELQADALEGVIIQEAARIIRLRAEDGGAGILLQHGIVSQGEAAGKGYVVDTDAYFDEKTELDDVAARLDVLNRRAGRAFRWCISDSLHEAMGPKAVTYTDNS